MSAPVRRIVYEFNFPFTFFGLAVYLAVGYILGAIFSDYVFADLARTVWTNIWTYVWIGLWPFCLAYYFLVAFLIIAAFMFVIGLLVVIFS